MNKNKILYIIYLILLVFILSLIILGNVSRKGYLSEFKFNDNNINKTLELNGIDIDETKKLFVVNDKFDNDALINYIFTNTAIKNYNYSFRLKYYSKVFRNSDIYGVYIDTNKIIQDNNFIKEIRFDENGSPFGILTSSQKLQYDEKIDNVHYKLKIKTNIIIILIVFCLFIFLFINMFYIIKDKNRQKLLIEYLNKTKSFIMKYKKYILKCIFILYSAVVVVFILFVVINSNIKRTSQLTDLELIAESKAGYVYKAKIKSDNKLFSIDRNSIKVDNTNNIRYYGYSLEITNKPLGSWHSTNIYYTDNHTFIISNESTNQNAYHYSGIQIPTYIGDKYKISILAKQLSEEGNISWHLNSNNNFKEITKKEVSNDYILLTDTREVYSKADGVLDLYLMIPQGVTEIESILIESVNSNLNVENEYAIFTSNKKMDTIKIQYGIKLNNIVKFLITISLLLLLLLLFIVYKDYIKLKHIKSFLYDEKFKKYRKYILVVYSFVVVLFILFVVINSNIKRTSQLTDLELIAESKAGYVYKAKIKSDNKLFSIDRNSIKVDNTNNIRYYGYSLEITNKPLGSWHSTNIYYTDNHTFIISNESTNQNAYHYSGIQIPTYIGDKYKISILAKQLSEEGNISWHLNSNNNFKEITKKEVSNDYILLTDTREVYSKADGVLDLYLMIPQGVTEIESILIESVNNNFNLYGNEVIFTSSNENPNLNITANLVLQKIFYYIIPFAIILLIILYDPKKLFYKEITINDWILFGFISLFCFISFQQGDIYHTVLSSYTYLSGHILDFYSYNTTLPFIKFNNYMPSTYILFALWNIPLKLFFGITYEKTLENIDLLRYVIWYNKILTSLFYIASIFIVYKISKKLNFSKNKSKATAYLWATTPIAIFSQFIFGQYDIFTLFFTLLGIYFYLKNDNFKFILFFGISLTFKYFTLFVFIILILQREKNIFRIIKSCILVFIPILIEILIYISDPAFRSGVLGFGATGYIFGLAINYIFITNIKVLLLFWILLCAYIYLNESKYTIEKSMMHYLALFSFMIFGLSFWHPQWIIFITPLLALSTVINKKYNFFIFIDIALMFSYVWFTVNIWPMHVDSFMLNAGIFHNIAYPNYSKFLMKNLFIDKNFISFTFFSGILLVNAIFKHPKFAMDNITDDISDSIPLMRLRFIVGIMIFVIPAFLVTLF